MLARIIMRHPGPSWLQCLIPVLSDYTHLSNPCHDTDYKRVLLQSRYVAQLRCQ